MVSATVLSNMRGRGFVFNVDDIPIVCPPPLGGQKLPEDNPFGTFGMVFDDYELAYRYDRTLYIRYPSSKLVGDTLRYTLTYVFDLKGFPVLRDDERTTDEVINEHWMTATTWGNRLENLRQVADGEKQYPVQWWKDGEVVYEKTIGEIVDIFLDPDRLEAQRVYQKAKMDAIRQQAPAPLRPKEESDPPEVQEQTVVVVPEPKMVRTGPGVKLTEQADGSVLAEREDDPKPVKLIKPVRWLPRQDNGFQHVDLASDLPSNIERLALEHSMPKKESRIPPGHAVLRGWGQDLAREVINGVAVEFRFEANKKRYEVEVNPKQLEELV